MARRGGIEGDAMSKSQERIYSAQQLIQALKSGVAGVKEQLQVLSILDGSAASWPGVNQAIDDMEFLIDMVAQTTQRLEHDVKKSETKAQDSSSEVVTLRETLSTDSRRSEELQNEVSQLTKENRQLTSKLAEAKDQVTKQGQTIWNLEKHQGELASNVQKYKQENELLGGELAALRATFNDQMLQLSSSKQDLAARNSDVQHLGRSAAEHKAQAADLQKQLESTAGTVRALQGQLEHMRGERQHYEKESERQADEATRLAAELNKVTIEANRQKEWAAVLKKVEGDKLRDEQNAHMTSRFEFEQARSELGKTIARLTAELSGKEQALITKTAEASNLLKQNGLLSIQLRDCQKQVAVMHADKGALMKELEAGKAEISKLHARIQAGVLQVSQLDKERVLAEGKVKEQSVADRSKLEAAHREAAREAAVQKALAEGWSRDLKELQGRLRTEQDKSNTLRQQLDALTKSQGGDNLEKHVEMVKSLATMEQVIRELRAQLNNKETEVRRVRAEAASAQKVLEKQVERLQRECDESAAQIQKMRNGDMVRLPALSSRPPQTLQDELDYLKKFVSDRGVVVMPAVGQIQKGNQTPTPRMLHPTSAPSKHVSILRHPTR